MSWADYANYLMAENCCEEGCIIGTNGAIWASAPATFKLECHKVSIDNEGKEECVDVDETKTLLEAVGHNGLAKSCKAGLRINKNKYMCIKWDEGVGYFKSGESAGGVIVVCTQCIVFARWNNKQKMGNGKPQNPGDCNKRAEDLAATLKGAGY